MQSADSAAVVRHCHVLVNVLHPTWHIIGYFRVALPSQSLDYYWNQCHVKYVIGTFLLRLILIKLPLRCLCMAHVNKGSHSITCHPHVRPKMEWAMPAFTARCRASPHFGRYSFCPPEGRRPSWLGWLLMYCGWFAGPNTVTHARSNCTGHRVVIDAHTAPLPLRHTASPARTKITLLVSSLTKMIVQHKTSVSCKVSKIFRLRQTRKLSAHVLCKLLL